MQAVQFTPKIYAHFLYAGSFVSETSSREVVSTAPIRVSDWPPGAYGYYFQRVLEGVSPGGKTIITDREDCGVPAYRGKVHTLEMVRAGVANGDKTYTQTLLRNMEGNGYKRVLQCPQGMIPIPDNAIVFAE